MPKVFGTRPEKEFMPNSRRVSSEALVMELGIVPISLCIPKANHFKFGRETLSVDGRWPVS